MKTITITHGLALEMDGWLIRHHRQIATASTRTEYRLTMSRSLAASLLEEVQDLAAVMREGVTTGDPATAANRARMLYAAERSIAEQLAE